MDELNLTPDQNPRDMVTGSMEPSLIMQTCRLSEAIKCLNNLQLVIIYISFRHQPATKRYGIKSK